MPSSFLTLLSAVVGSSGGGGGVSYLLRDLFTTDEGPPVTSPRTCEPGPGTLVVNDADGNCSVSSSTFHLVPLDTPAEGPNVVVNDTYCATAGVAYIANVNILSPAGTEDYVTVGLATATNFVGYDLPFGMLHYTGSIYGYWDTGGAGTAIGSSTYDTPEDYAIVKRAGGGYFMLRGGVLEWVASADATGDPVYPRVQTYDASVDVKDVRVADLTGLDGSWDSRFGPAADYKAAPLADWDILVGSSSDGIVEVTFNMGALSTNYCILYGRYDSDASYGGVTLKLAGFRTGGNFTLYENNGGGTVIKANTVTGSLVNKFWRIALVMKGALCYGIADEVGTTNQYVVSFDGFGIYGGTKASIQFATPGLSNDFALWPPSPTFPI